jgi:hypothetical protein
MAKVRFTFERDGRDLYRLANVGEDAAYRVHVEAASTSRSIDGELDFDVFPPGKSEKYLVSQELRGSRQIVVTWHEGPDPWYPELSHRFEV